MDTPCRRATFVLICLSFATLLASCGASGTASAETRQRASYVITDLGPDGATSSRAYGVNSEGDVALQTKDRHGHEFPRTWRAGVPGTAPTNESSKLTGYAYAINDRGQVAGYSTGRDTDHACVWDNGKRTDIGSEPRSFSHAYGINNVGDVVGVADMDGYYGRAFRYHDGKTSLLGLLSGGHSCAFGVNDNGDAVGYATVAFVGVDWYYEAVLWHGTTATGLTIPGVAYAVNNHGLIVGVYTGPYEEKSRAFAWSNGKGTILSTLGGSSTFAYSVNDRGHIAGAALTRGGRLHAVMWKDDGVLDLNDHVDPNGWELVEARGVNNSGQIVGTGRFHGGQRAFLLTPTRTSADASLNRTLLYPSDSKPFSPNMIPSEPQPDPTHTTRQITSVAAVFSKPVAVKHVTFQAIVQAHWRLPNKDPRGDLDNYRLDEITSLYSRLAAFGQTNLFVGIRITNHSDQPVRLDPTGLFTPRLKPIGSRRKLSYDYSVPPNVLSIGYSPYLAPGQSLTVSKTSRLAWRGSELWFECLIGPGEFRTHRGLTPGSYALGLEFELLDGSPHWPSHTGPYWYFHGVVHLWSEPFLIK